MGNGFVQITKKSLSNVWNISDDGSTSILGNSDLYSFNYHEFNNCTQTGENGPTLEQCLIQYTPSWTDELSNFNVYTGTQVWTVPESAVYKFTVAGASGGSQSPAAVTHPDTFGIPGLGSRQQ